MEVLDWCSLLQKVESQITRKCLSEKTVNYCRIIKIFVIILKYVGSFFHYQGNSHTCSFNDLSFVIVSCQVRFLALFFGQTVTIYSILAKPHAITILIQRSKQSWLLNLGDWYVYTTKLWDLLLNRNVTLLWSKLHTLFLTQLSWWGGWSVCGMTCDNILCVRAVENMIGRQIIENTYFLTNLSCFVKTNDWNGLIYSTNIIC